MIPQAQKRMNIAPGLNFDPQAVIGNRFAVVGKSGSGKSWTVKTLCEEHLLANIPLIILDPESEFSVFADRFPMIVAANEGRGQVSLTQYNAADLASLVFEQKLSIVLDLGTVKHTDQDVVAAEFLGTFWDLAITAFSRGKQTVCSIVVDEAQEFIPQKGSKDSSVVLVDIAKRGRKRGVGMIIASQRPSSIDKDVLTQGGCLIAHQLVGIDVTYLATDPIPLKRGELGTLMRPFKPGEAVLTGSLIDGGEEGYITTRIRPSIMAGEAPEMKLPGELRPLSADVIGALQAGLSHLEAEHAEENKAHVEAEHKMLHQNAILADENKRLKAEVERLTKQVEQLKADVAAKPKEVIVRVPVPSTNGNGNGAHKEPQAEDVPPEEDGGGRTPLALTRAVNWQRRKFDQLMGQIRRQKPSNVRIFAYLLMYDEFDFTKRKLAWNVGLSTSTIDGAPPTWFVKHGLISKERGGSYKSTTRAKLAQDFPDLDTETLVVELLAAFDPERRRA